MPHDIGETKAESWMTGQIEQSACSAALTDGHKGGAHIDSAGDDSGQEGAILADGLEDDRCVEHDAENMKPPQVSAHFKET